MTNSNEVTEQTVERYKKYVNPGIASILKFSGFDVPESHADGCYIWDVSGRKFLDCVGGYGAFSLGHRHPKVVEAVKKQLEKEALKSHFFMSMELGEACEKLAEILPGNTQYSFLTNSGTEAVEGALKLARIHTARPGYVSTINSFHGKSFGSLSVSGREVYKTKFGPLMDHCKNVPFGDIEAAKAAIDNETAAFVVEIVQGEGGVNIAPDGYFQELEKTCRSSGTLLIIDEVRTGLGRTGKMFASEHYAIEPDITTTGKALGGGVMPVGAFSSSEEIWQSMFGENPYLHSSTFGGNPIACAAVISAIDVTKEEGLVERSHVLGKRLLDGLGNLKSELPGVVKEVRGLGLLAGIEFEHDDFAALVIASCGRRDLLVAYSLNNPRVIRVEPPFIITEDELDKAVEIITESVKETAAMLEGVV